MQYNLHSLIDSAVHDVEQFREVMKRGESRLQAVAASVVAKASIKLLYIYVSELNTQAGISRNDMNAYKRLIYYTDISRELASYHCPIQDEDLILPF